MGCMVSNCTKTKQGIFQITQIHIKITRNLYLKKNCRTRHVCASVLLTAIKIKNNVQKTSGGNVRRSRIRLYISIINVSNASKKRCKRTSIQQIEGPQKEFPILNAFAHSSGFERCLMLRFS